MAGSSSIAWTSELVINFSEKDGLINDVDDTVVSEKCVVVHRGVVDIGDVVCVVGASSVCDDV